MTLLLRAAQNETNL